MSITRELVDDMFAWFTRDVRELFGIEVSPQVTPKQRKRIMTRIRRHPDYVRCQRELRRIVRELKAAGCSDRDELLEMTVHRAKDEKISFNLVAIVFEAITPEIRPVSSDVQRELFDVD